MRAVRVPLKPISGQGRFLLVGKRIQFLPTHVVLRPNVKRDGTPEGHPPR